MGNINYFCSIVKLLETPKPRLVKKKTVITQFRCEMAQFKKSKIISVNIWGKLADEVKNSYRENDYVFIEGYVFNQVKKNQKKTIKTFPSSGVTISRLYPFLLASASIDQNISK